MNASDAWLAGVNGAKPGILMPADPQTGTPPFTEDTVPGIESPTAQVAKTGQSQCVPFKCYKDVVVLQEGGSEYKYFAPGVGQIKTEPLASGGKQEIENLVNLTQLSPSGLAQISAEALKLDQHAQVAGAGRLRSCPSRQAHALSGRRSVTAGAPRSGRSGLQDLSSGGGRDARSARRQPGARPRGDDQPRRGIGQRQVDPDLAARRPDAARLGPGRLRRR